MSTIKKTAAVAKTNSNKKTALLASIKEFGRTAGNGDNARVAALKAFGIGVRDNVFELPAIDHKDYDAKLTDEAKLVAREYLEGMADINKSKLNENSVKTYAAHFKCFAAPAVVSNIDTIETAVTAFTSKKTKKQCHNKGFFDVMYSMASMVRKAEKAGEKIPEITPVLIGRTITPKKDAADKTPGKKAKPDEIARAAFIDGVKSFIKDGGLDEKAQKRLINACQAIGVKLDA